jgi:predicted nucleic acid-binding protein
VIILDTNVVSELMRGREADSRVVAWLWGLDADPTMTIFTRAELLAGLALLPAGRRRNTLLNVLATVSGDIGTCLPFTEECAAHYADIVAERRRQGRPIATMDALIASIVREVGATLATRNTEDFAGLDLAVVNPWETPAA